MSESSSVVDITVSKAGVRVERLKRSEYSVKLEYWWNEKTLISFRMLLKCDISDFSFLHGI